MNCIALPGFYFLFPACIDEHLVASSSFIAEIGHCISFEHLCLVKDFIFYIQK